MARVRRFRWLTFVLVGAVCSVGAVGAGAIQTFVWRGVDFPALPAVTALAPGEGTAVLAARLRSLFKQWKAIPAAQVGAKAPAIRSQIGAALTGYLLMRLDERPRPSPLGMQDDLNDALTTAIWESIFGMSKAAIRAARKANPPTPLAFVMEGSGSASNLYVTGFPVGFGNVYSVVIQALSSVGGRYAVVGVTGREFDSSIPKALRLRPFSPHEFRLLVWGLHIGSPEGLTTIAVYKFDGKTLQTLWSRQNVPAARVGLSGGLVVIESHTHVSAKAGPVFHYDRTFYLQVPTGLKQVRIERWTEH